MKKIIMLIVCTFLLCGCVKENTVDIKMDCEGQVLIKTFKINDTLTCELQGENYVFNIIEINNQTESVTLKTSSYGLTDTLSLLDQKNEFVLKKGETLKLHTQSTDYQERVTFEFAKVK